MLPEDDILTFSEEPFPEGVATIRPAAWKLLIVDDDPDVHIATEHALGGVELLGGLPAFLHARSATEALDVLGQHPDVAVILLDVVMETQDAGLQLVDQIRRDLNLTMPRIILRTGQPGYAPELKAIRDYDINDYKTKSELTRNKLFTTVLSALRAYDQLQRMDASRRGLEQIVQASGALLGGSGLQAFSAGVIRQLAALLGVAPEGLLCAQANLGIDPDDDSFSVLAASGHYEPLIGRQLDKIGDSRIIASLRQCLEQGRHQFEGDHLTLYFPMRDNRRFAVYVDSVNLPGEMDRNLLEVFCSNVSVCADNIKLIGHLRDSAYFDRLVGLPNRAAFVQAIDEHLVRGESETAVALLDIDQFAEINNAFGHDYGDRLLKAMAERLGHHLSQDCFIARLSGDAFGLLGHEQALSPERLRKVLAEPYRIDGAEHAVAVSSGIVRLRDSGPSGQSVIKDATIARKQAREKGVNSDAYYSPNLGLQAKERTHLLQQLQNAFEHEQLFPVFQPQVRLADGRVIGFESLMRWRDASGAMLPPDRFIPLAEQSGLIVGMGTWILRAALRELGRLGAEGWPGLRMAVNVSAVQFRMPDFVEVVRRALDETGVDPHQLELEITESVAMMGQGMVVDVLGRLREMGIGLAIDDFGTGFSSLSYLDRLPLDRIKIDRAFVQAMGGEGEGKRIADVIIQLGHSLDLEIIAEGVERDTQAIRLRELGCHEAQGYFFGKPMTADALRAWLRDDVANPRA